MLFTYVIVNIILITAVKALRMTSLVVTEPISQTSNITLTWFTNSTDPDTANLELRHPKGSNAPVAQALDLSKRFFVAVSPFSSVNRGARARFAFLDVSNGNALALTPPFQVNNDGSVQETNGNLPIITGTSAIPSNTGTPDPSSKSGGLSTAAAVGIGIGAALVVVTACTLGLVLIRRRRRAHVAEREAALKLELDGKSSCGNSSFYTRGSLTEKGTIDSPPKIYPGFQFELDASQPEPENPPMELAEEQRAELAPGETGVPHIQIRSDPEECDFLSPTTTEAAYEISGRAIANNGEPFSPGQI